MLSRSDSLKNALLDLAAQGTDPVDHYTALMAQRPLFVLQPLSGIGRSRCKYLLTLMPGVVALVDDGLSAPEMLDDGPFHGTGPPAPRCFGN